MSNMVLYIGNKNLSSWSLRPWVLMKQMGIDFEEVIIRLDQLETREQIISYSPSGLVPALIHDGQTVWDSLAIAEYLHDLYPEKRMWPQDRKSRAIARCISAEMHAGFSQLRLHWPMNYSRNAMSHLISPGVRRDIDRIIQIWTMCRERYHEEGPFLFGHFTVADAMFAPVVSRFRTYGPLDLNMLVLDYCQAMWSLSAMREWGDGSRQEIMSEAI